MEATCSSPSHFVRTQNKKTTDIYVFQLLNDQLNVVWMCTNDHLKKTEVSVWHHLSKDVRLRFLLCKATGNLCIFIAVVMFKWQQHSSKITPPWLTWPSFVDSQPRAKTADSTVRKHSTTNSDCCMLNWVTKLQGSWDTVVITHIISFQHGNVERKKL